MPAYSGKFVYTANRGEALNQGPCQISFDQDSCIVTPATGVPIAFDLGDIDRAAPGDWSLQLDLYTGHALNLTHFGPAFGNMSAELLDAWRQRTVRCLLLEDLEELGRCQGLANHSAGELRVYKSNLAFLPQSGTPFQWRLADVESIRFDDSSYSIVLTRGQDQLVLSKFARKTDEVLQKLQEALAALRESSAAALRDVFPFLAPPQLARLLIAMPEGRSTPLSLLSGIHPDLAAALIARAVDEPLKPYFDALHARAAGQSLMTGFKFIRPGEIDSDGEENGGAEAAPAGASEDEPMPLFFWFFFPLPNQLAAWEATTGAGRATYLFRAAAPFEPAVSELTRGLALVNFRREPVYLPDSSLEQQPRFRRYAIGARKLPDLRALRAAYAGRAIHSSPEEWQAQVDALLARR